MGIRSSIAAGMIRPYATTTPVQPEGRNVMPAADWLRGANLGLPVVLGG